MTYSKLNNFKFAWEAHDSYLKLSDDLAIQFTNPNS